MNEYRNYIIVFNRNKRDEVILFKSDKSIILISDTRYLKFIPSNDLKHIYVTDNTILYRISMDNDVVEPFDVYQYGCNQFILT